MARSPRRPPPGKLRRKAATRPPKTVIWVFCEGEKTEPAYLFWFARVHGHTSIHVKPIKGCGVPKTVVEMAAEKKKELVRAERKHKNSFDDKFEVWAMCDRDAHPRLDEARIQARDNRIGFAFSNPCFELWGILHLTAQTAHIERHACQKKLNDLMSKYDHKGSAVFDTTMLEGKYDEACKRALHLEERAKCADDPYGNPSTTVWKLTDSIRRGEG